jgi:hypothetical protein
MSFERFASSDVYIFEHVSGYIQCCGCWLNDGGFGISVEENDGWFVNLKTPREALEHLDKHEAAGHDVGGARRRIEKEYEDLDATIPVYQRQTFRDVSNGE